MIFNTIRAGASVALMMASVICSGAQDLNIIPYPAKAEMGNGNFQLTPETKIYYAPQFKREAEFLQHYLHNEFQLDLKAATQTGASAKNGIYLMASPATDIGTEGYTLNVKTDNVSLGASKPAGIFYAIQTLRQIVKKDGNKITVSSVAITDQPRFAWRAFMLDEGRYFKGEKEVKRILDEMALLKLNVFHWHLTDDTGWRIEIKKYPKLTEIGSTRKESELGTWLSDNMDGKVHSGFYTQEQIKDIVRYAQDRNITIIPEIEMPGHASAAIASYPWLGPENKQIEVPTKFRIQLNVFNVANPRVIQFLHDVLDELMTLFPGNIIHIGGDEVKYDQWKESAEVKAYMAKNGSRTPADLQIAFTNSISQYLAQKKHRMMGWNEILGGHQTNNDSLDARVQQKLSDNVIIHFWTGDPAIVSSAAEKGYDVVNSRSEFTYVDYDYATTSLEKAYSFDPVPATLPQPLHKKVLGLGCQMWGEWIPTVAHMNELIYPRIAAYAEIGWTPAAKKDIVRLKKGLDVYFKKHWAEQGIVLLPEFK